MKYNLHVFFYIISCIISLSCSEKNKVLEGIREENILYTNNTPEPKNYYLVKDNNGKYISAFNYIVHYNNSSDKNDQIKLFEKFIGYWAKERNITGTDKELRKNCYNIKYYDIIGYEDESIQTDWIGRIDIDFGGGLDRFTINNIIKINDDEYIFYTGCVYGSSGDIPIIELGSIKFTFVNDDEIIFELIPNKIFEYDAGYHASYFNEKNKLYRATIIEENSETKKDGFWWIYQPVLNYFPSHISTVDVNVMEGPTMDAKIIGQINRNIKILVLESHIMNLENNQKIKIDNIDGIEAQWVLIQTEEQMIGWVFSGYLKEL
jgi:hypothetical protein